MSVSIPAGERFGALVVTDPLQVNRKVECMCDCGTVKMVGIYNLRGGLSKSCGCVHRVLARRLKLSHGMKGTPEYRTWRQMISRCHDRNTKSYRDYGAKGIRVCDEWRHDFRAFYDHVGPRPDGSSIDRIDATRGYEPGNVRWLSRSLQNRNKRNSRLLIHEYDQVAWLVLEGGHRIIDVAKAFGCDRSVVDSSVKRQRDKWPAEGVAQ